MGGGGGPPPAPAQPSSAGAVAAAAAAPAPANELTASARAPRATGAGEDDAAAADAASSKSGSGSGSGSESSSWPSDLGPSCLVCQCTGGGVLLLKCELCDIAVHSFCVHKRLSHVEPTQRWRCARCFTEEDAGYKKLPRIRKFRKTQKSGAPPAVQS